MSSNKMTISHSERVFMAERVFNAPRERVFAAFSQSEHLKQWWGPKRWTLPVSKMDFRAGGSWHYCMKGPEGEESWGKALYHEVVAPERIVYTDYFSDADGNVVAGLPPAKITLTFTEVNGQTRVVTSGEYTTAAELEQVLAMGMVEGFSETWDRLEEYLVAGKLA